MFENRNWNFDSSHSQTSQRANYEDLLFDKQGNGALVQVSEIGILLNDKKRNMLSDYDADAMRRALEHPPVDDAAGIDDDSLLSFCMPRRIQHPAEIKDFMDKCDGLHDLKAKEVQKEFNDKVQRAEIYAQQYAKKSKDKNSDDDNE